MLISYENLSTKLLAVVNDLLMILVRATLTFGALLKITLQENVKQEGKKKKKRILVSSQNKSNLQIIVRCIIILILKVNQVKISSDSFPGLSMR